MAAQPRTFDLIRHHDISNVSGIGIIAQGTQFRDGQTAVQWCVPDMPRTLQIWDCLDDVIQIHGHDGLTEVRFHDVD